MKKYAFIALICLIACDDEPDTNLSGSWIFVEPPETPSRKNRNDNSVPAFDVVFDISGKQITHADLLLDGLAVSETATLNHHGETADITIEASGFILTLTGCRRANQVIVANNITYQLPSGATGSYKGLSISPYKD